MAWLILMLKKSICFLRESNSIHYQPVETYSIRKYDLCRSFQISECLIFMSFVFQYSAWSGQVHQIKCTPPKSVKWIQGNHEKYPFIIMANSVQKELFSTLKIYEQKLLHKLKNLSSERLRSRGALLVRRLRNEPFWGWSAFLRPRIKSEMLLIE